MLDPYGQLGWLAINRVFIYITDNIQNDFQTYQIWVNVYNLRKRFAWFFLVIITGIERARNKNCKKKITLRKSTLNYCERFTCLPQSPGKVGDIHRSMKNVINLEKYSYPWELEKQIEEFVHYYNFERYHESLNNLTPADVYAGQSKRILNKREEIKQKTMQTRRQYNLKNWEVESVCN